MSTQFEADIREQLAEIRERLARLETKTDQFLANYALLQSKVNRNEQSIVQARAVAGTVAAIVSIIASGIAWLMYNVIGANR